MKKIYASFRMILYFAVLFVLIVFSIIFGVLGFTRIKADRHSAQEVYSSLLEELRENPQINQSRRLADVKKASDEADAAQRRYQLLFIITASLSAISTVVFDLYFSMSVTRPLRKLAAMVDNVAAGDLTMDFTYRSDNEIGRLSAALERIKLQIDETTSIVESFSNGDFTATPRLHSEQDKLGKSLLRLSNSFGLIVTAMSDTSRRVTRESAKVAHESQELALGTTQQASSVEELSSVVFEISLNTKENAKMASSAALLSETVRKNAAEGESLMRQLDESVSAAAAATKSIERIIKVIDEISFQTNILSMNAAVEAANAGQNSGGFAVVASEVRSLATKSAANAKESSELIANTLEKARIGAQIAKKTADAFRQIVSGVEESARLIGDIAQSSEEQASAIEQVNLSISQVAQVVNLNGTAAEKCAFSADKMSKQAQNLQETISGVKIKKYAKKPAPAPVLPAVFETSPPDAVFAPAEAAPPAEIEISPEISSSDFGKY